MYMYINNDGCSSYHQYIPQYLPCQTQQKSTLVLTWHNRYISQITDILLLYIAQIRYLYDAMQPGPIYFLTPYKGFIFDICCESVPNQVSLNTCRYGTHNMYMNIHVYHMLAQMYIIIINYYR